MDCINGLLACLLFVWVGCHVPHWALGLVVALGGIYLGVRLVTDGK